MQEKTIKFTRGVPPVETFPTEQLIECSKMALREFGDQIQQYSPASGFIPLRQVIAAEQQSHLEQVVIGQGSLQLLDLMARFLVKPGDLVYVESPSYDRAITTLRRAGATVVGIPIDDGGVDISELEQRLHRGERPKLFYIIPDFQNPNGSLMALERRQIITSLSEEFGFFIIEDSPYRTLRYKGEDIPSIFKLYPDHVILMSSFSKLICPGLRVGYAVVPQELINPLVKMAEDTYINTSYINQAIVYKFIHEGWFETNLNKLKHIYSQRMEKMISELQLKMDGLGDWTVPEGGFFIGLRLSEKIPIQHLMEKTKNAGLELTDGRGFFASGGGEEFIRLPFCGLTPDEIELGISQLAKVVGQM